MDILSRFWKQVIQFSIPPRSFALFVMGMLIIEIIFSIIWLKNAEQINLFEQYLSQNTYQSFQKVDEFLSGDLYIVIDDLVGWKNKPNASYKSIQYDQYGSRSYLGINDNPTQEKVIFLGDSRINGGQWVENSETINAYLDSESFSTLNFASFDYCFDQSFLLMKSLYKQFKPDTFVVGIDSNPGRMLDTHFLPFYDITLLPRLKPRINFNNHSLLPVIPDYKRLLHQFPHNENLINYLETHDKLYSKFKDYNRRTVWKQTPILKLMTHFSNLIDLKQNNDQPQIENINQVKQLLQVYQQFSKQKQLKLIFIVFASRNEVNNPPQAYQDVISLLRQESLYFVDTQLLFEQYPGDVLNLYADEIHCSPLGNQIIADVLRLILNQNI